MLELSIRKSLGDFALDVAWASEGEVVCLFGASGSGKSLTLQCLAGLTRPDAGTITVAGRCLFDHERGINVRPQERHLGYVFQGYALFPHLTVEANIAFGLFDRPASERRRRAGELIEQLGLGPAATLKPGQLSGGQQQRVALARAIAPEPALLLLDEPFSALDAPLRRQLREEVGAIIRRYAKATVIVTHDLAEAFQLADRIVIYDRGRVVQTALRDDIIAAPASEHVARLLGFRNVLRGRVQAVDADLVSLEWHGQILTAPIPPSTGPLSAGQEVTFFVRPEHIRFVPKDRPPRRDGRMNRLRASIVDRADLGASYSLRLAVEGPDRATAELLEVDVPRLVYQLLGLNRDPHWEIAIQPSAIQLVSGASSRKA
ncbi:MAG: ABC transporter ATP-binding protein [Gemmatimonadota bacterium]